MTDRRPDGAIPEKLDPGEIASLALSPSRPKRQRIFPVLESLAYFDHAAITPLPSPVARAIGAHTHDVEHFGSANWGAWTQRIERTRRSAAALLSVVPERIAFVKNTTAGINAVAGGFPWKEGDSVVVQAGDFPSNVFPWVALEARGVRVRRVGRTPGHSIGPGEILEAADSTTRLVALCLVAYDDGFRFPVEEVAQKANSRGIFVLVDAIQGLGAIPFDASLPGIDAVTADGHKWLLGPEGAGILALSPRLLEILDVSEPGWMNIAHPPGSFQTDRLEWVDGAKRFEGGSLNTAGYSGLGASLDLIEAVGIREIWKALESLTALLRERLASRGHEVVSSVRDGQRSGIVSFRARGQSNSHRIAKSLMGMGIQISARQGFLRAAPHFYLDSSDLDRLTEGLETALQKSGGR